MKIGDKVIVIGKHERKYVGITWRIVGIRDDIKIAKIQSDKREILLKTDFLKKLEETKINQELEEKIKDIARKQVINDF